jgi:hypothetical protein
MREVHNTVGILRDKLVALASSWYNLLSIPCECHLIVGPLVSMQQRMQFEHTILRSTPCLFPTNSRRSFASQEHKSPNITMLKFPQVYGWGTPEW